MVFSALVSVPFCRRSQSVEDHEQAEGAGLRQRYDQSPGRG